jgi:signal transduction histidine kinase
MHAGVPQRGCTGDFVMFGWVRFGESGIVNGSDISGNTPRERELLRIIDFHTALLAMAAHDLRQPLQVIMNSYSWLGRRPIEASERKHVERGELAVSQLTTQLDLLIEAIRLRERSPEAELAPVELQSFLAELCRDYAELARHKGVVLNFTPTRASVMSNHTLLAGILRNLIRNALKYAAPVVTSCWDAVGVGRISVSRFTILDPE